MVTYRQRVREIERRLAGRSLVYFGTRGTDARSLLEISNFEEIFSQIAPLEAVSIRETSLESIKKERVDLDQYSIDLDTSEAVHQFRKDLLRAFRRPAAVIPYRPCALLTAACFTRSNLVRYLGLFHEFQACFEHKPWIETQLAAEGIPVIPWRYYADDDIDLIREAAERAPLVLRTNRSDGGAGLLLIHDPSQIRPDWPHHIDGFLAAAPFLQPGIPLNVNACVFPGGKISLHPPSLQLLGLPSCTNRIFGYCGNDFAAVKHLDTAILKDLEIITLAAGRWLGSKGYLGAFGLDALFHNGTVFLVEINPRFQGSSALAAFLTRDIDHPDLFLDHIAAHLELPPPTFISLPELARLQSDLAHLVCHNLLSNPVELCLPDDEILPFRCSLLPKEGVLVHQEGILFSAILEESITNSGFELSKSIELTLEAFIKSILHPPVQISLWPTVPNSRL